MPYDKYLVSEHTLKYMEDVMDFTLVCDLQGKQKLCLGIQRLDLYKYYNELYVFLLPMKRQFVWR